MVVIILLFCSAYMTHVASTTGMKGVGKLMTSQSAVKTESQDYKGDYVLKIEFEVESTPGEVLRTI